MEKKSKVVGFAREKETKNTVKFAEVQTQGEAPIIGTLYVQKWFAGDASKVESHGRSTITGIKGAGADGKSVLAYYLPILASLARNRKAHTASKKGVQTQMNKTPH